MQNEDIPEQLSHFEVCHQSDSNFFVHAPNPSIMCETHAASHAQREAGNVNNSCQRNAKEQKAVIGCWMTPLGMPSSQAIHLGFQNVSICADPVAL